MMDEQSRVWPVFIEIRDAVKAVLAPAALHRKTYPPRTQDGTPAAPGPPTPKNAAVEMNPHFFQTIRLTLIVISPLRTGFARM
jgi:hypothetical protein